MKKIKNKKSSGKAGLGDYLSVVKSTLYNNPVSSVLFFSIFLGLVVNAAGGYLAWQKYVVKERQSQLESFSQSNAKIAAANVANYLHDIHKRLEIFTNRGSLKTSLRVNDTVGVMDIKKALTNSFPQAKSIRIFRTGEAKLDLDGEPPIRFAELDIIRKAEKHIISPPEAIDIGGGWRINVAVPVPKNKDEPAVGVILITLPVEDLYKNVQLNLENKGEIALFQTFKNKSRLLKRFGEGDLHRAERVAVPDSPWSVEFTASKALMATTSIDFSVHILVWGVCGLSILAIFIMGGLGIGRSIKKRQLAIEETNIRMGRNKSGGASKDGSGGDILDVAIAIEDQDILSGEEEDEPSDQTSDQDEELETSAEVTIDLPEHIFRRYDIRGLVDTEVNNELALLVGKALGSEALENDETSILVARDARTHSPILMEKLIRGIMDTGCNVINIGTVPTPLLYFAAETIEQTNSGVMVTASHNPADYNGFKVVMKGKARTEEGVKSVLTRIKKGKFARGIGRESMMDVVEQYIETIFSDVALAGDLRVVIDASNAVAGVVAPKLFEELGCEVIPLYCDFDGSFPNHDPDPSKEENLQDLIAKVKEVEADLGVALDGDGDRLTVVTSTGEIIWADRLLMLFAKDILSRNPGADVIFDVKSSRHLNSVVNSCGGRPIMWKTGHAPMRSKVLEVGALLGGEFSGHIFIKDRWFGFDDGMYAAARLAEIMSLRDEPLDDIFKEFPIQSITPEYRIPIEESRKFDVIQELVDNGSFPDAKITSIDGIRAEYVYGWGLIRASNTAAELTMRFEAESDDQIHQLKAMFVKELKNVEPSIQINW